MVGNSCASTSPRAFFQIFQQIRMQGKFCFGVGVKSFDTFFRFWNRIEPEITSYRPARPN